MFRFLIAAVLLCLFASYSEAGPFRKCGKQRRPLRNVARVVAKPIKAVTPDGFNPACPNGRCHR